MSISRRCRWESEQLREEISGATTFQDDVLASCKAIGKCDRHCSLTSMQQRTNLVKLNQTSMRTHVSKLWQSAVLTQRVSASPVLCRSILRIPNAANLSNSYEEERPLADGPNSCQWLRLKLIIWQADRRRYEVMLNALLCCLNKRVRTICNDHLRVFLYQIEQNLYNVGLSPLC